MAERAPLFLDPKLKTVWAVACSTAILLRLGDFALGSDFATGHRLAQGSFFSRFHPEQAGFRGAAYRLEPKHRALNLAPAIQEQALAYFAEKGIAWHLHANHGLSSQVCCLNYLMPLAFEPAMLSRIIGRAFRIEPPEILAMEQDAAGRDWFVAFEWMG